MAEIEEKIPWYIEEVPGMPTRICSVCEKEFPVCSKYWYFGPGKIRPASTRCITCDKEHRINLYDNRHHSIHPQRWRIPVNPLEFDNDYDKESLKNFMNRLGWIFSEEKQLWWKPNVKNEDGTWVGIKDRNLPAGGKIPKKHATNSDMKICRKCENEFPKTSEFFFQSKRTGYWHSYCRKCESQMNNIRLKMLYVPKMIHKPKVKKCVNDE
jgi:ribosomal protein L40E